MVKILRSYETEDENRYGGGWNDNMNNLIGNTYEVRSLLTDSVKIYCPEHDRTYTIHMNVIELVKE